MKARTAMKAVVHLSLVPLLLGACAQNNTRAASGQTDDATAPGTIVVCDSVKGPVDSGPARGLYSCQPGQICGHSGLIPGYSCCYLSDVGHDCYP